MKKLFCCLLILLSVKSFAQDQKLIFTKIIQSDSVGKSVLQAAINEWFINTYNSSKNVIQLNDPVSGVIIAKALFQYTYPGVSYACYSGVVEYTIKISIKDDKYKIEIYDIFHKVNPGNHNSCEFGYLTTSSEFATTGAFKASINKVYADVKTKCETNFNELIRSIESKTANLKTTSDW